MNTVDQRARAEENTEATAASAAFAEFWRARPVVRAAGRRWVAACSGGLDSTVLLHLLTTRRSGGDGEGDGGGGGVGGVLTAAHLHHHWRGRAADDDAAFVASLAAAWGVDCQIAEAAVPALARARKAGTEEAGRAARLLWWTLWGRSERAAGRPPPIIWLGHHADDQAETVLFRLRRGCARRGGAGLRAWQPFFSKKGTAAADADGNADFIVARPLLTATRAELAAHARVHGLSWREDATNDDPRWTRNAIRHSILPRLTGRSSASGPLPKRLCALAASLARTEDAELTAAAAWLAAAWRPLEGSDGPGGRLPWPRGSAADGGADAGEPFPDSPSRRRLILREAYEMATGHRLASRVLLAALEEQAERGRRGSRLSLPGGWLAIREAAGLRFHRSSPSSMSMSSAVDESAGELFRIEAPGGGDVPVLEWPDRWLRFERAPFPGAGACRPGDGTFSAGEAWLADGAFEWPLICRRRRPGDRFHPLGAAGTRKVKDFLIDRRAEAADKSRTLVFADAAGIVWLWPYRIAARVRVPRPGAPAWRATWRSDS